MEKVPKIKRKNEEGKYNCSGGTRKSTVGRGSCCCNLSKEGQCVSTSVQERKDQGETCLKLCLGSLLGQRGKDTCVAQKDLVLCCPGIPVLFL